MISYPPPQNEHRYYPHALAFVLHWEGRYVHRTDDPGGATNMGITQSTFNEWQRDFAGRNEFNLRDVKDIKFDEAREIYYQNYWVGSGADRMAWPLCLAHFDTAVNFGITGAVKFVQEALSILEDGIWGPQTQACYNAACKECLAHLVIFARRRYRFQRVLEDKSQWVFLEGWLNRDAALLELVRQHLVLINAA